jgi:hypothetical protein
LRFLEQVKSGCLSDNSRTQSPASRTNERGPSPMAGSSWVAVPMCASRSVNVCVCVWGGGSDSGQLSVMIAIFLTSARIFHFGARPRTAAQPRGTVLPHATGRPNAPTPAEKSNTSARTPTRRAGVFHLGPDCICRARADERPDGRRSYHTLLTRDRTGASGRSPAGTRGRSR